MTRDEANLLALGVVMQRHGPTWYAENRPIMFWLLQEFGTVHRAFAHDYREEIRREAKILLSSSRHKPKKGKLLT